MTGALESALAFVFTWRSILWLARGKFPFTGSLAALSRVTGYYQINFAICRS
ncbi:hypothetical protein JOF48_000541 [Arthrobacter stackebrandtii]|uniref:Uncharacterized protein n=1 Tax=Arthrobacter stackebrandtii TaxID=272161 RepID=A0ABS4YSH4_9MICC|nr:hypothetical protein [Arthrobacter stackebrandtii]